MVLEMRHSYFDSLSSSNLQAWRDIRCTTVQLQPATILTTPPAASMTAIGHHSFIAPHMLTGSSLGAIKPLNNAMALAPTCVGMASQTAPCSTLFVANLGQFCGERELKDLFGR